MLNNTEPFKNNLNKIFIGGLPTTVNKQTLEDALCLFGSILDIKFRDKKKRSGGFATVSFQSIESASLAIKANTIKVEGREVTILPCLEGEQLSSYLTNYNKRRVFIKGLPWKLSVAKLKSLVQVFGPLEYCYKKELPGKRTIGFATFADLESADRAIEQGTIKMPETGKTFKIFRYKLQVEVKKAQKTRPNVEATHTQPKKNKKSKKVEKKLDLNYDKKTFRKCSQKTAVTLEKQALIDRNDQSSKYLKEKQLVLRSNIDLFFGEEQNGDMMSSVALEPSQPQAQAMSNNKLGKIQNPNLIKIWMKINLDPALPTQKDWFDIRNNASSYQHLDSNLRFNSYDLSPNNGINWRSIENAQRKHFRSRGSEIEL